MARSKTLKYPAFKKIVKPAKIGGSLGVSKVMPKVKIPTEKPVGTLKFSKTPKIKIPKIKYGGFH